LIVRQLDEAQAGRGQVLVPVASVTESPEARNNRKGYDEAKLNELAASIQLMGSYSRSLLRRTARGMRSLRGIDVLRLQCERVWTESQLSSSLTSMKTPST
jgi:hypothetical protein